MHHPIRVSAALAALASSALIAQTAPAGPRTPALPELLGEPSTFAPLRFDANGDCDNLPPYELDAWRSMSPTHQDMLLRLFRRPAASPAVHACWMQLPAPGVASLFNAAIQGPEDFQFGQRWTFTAGSGGGLQQGDPTIIRYSFVPDGTFVPSGSGEAPGSSNLFAQMNAAFGNQATWQNVFHDAFDRWGELTGVSYVFEPNDDGAPMFGAGGGIGVRGDVRISMKFLDGPSNTLAYNFFPSGGGDMVLDSGDAGNFANSFGNYRFLFNIVTHEHGHGLGIAHVCPLNNTKLMEPIATTAFSGPQFDDILTAQRLYGDPFEPNDQNAEATDLGTVPNTTTNVTNVSIDGTSDVDQYKFTVLSDKLATIRVVPVGTPYLEGPQVGFCNTGSTLNPATLRNLNVFLYNSNGTQLITFSASAVAGQTETISNQPITGGTYTIRVTATGTDTIQPYRLEVGIVDNGPIATATPVGSGCGGLTWNALTDPVLGQTVVHTLVGISNPAQSIGLVLVGTNGIPGGVSLGALGAPGCSVYQQSDIILAQFPLVGGTMVWILPIPADSGLIGTSIWTQGALVVPPGTNALNVLTGNAAELVVGTQ